MHGVFKEEVQEYDAVDFKIRHIYNTRVFVTQLLSSFGQKQ